MVWCFDQTVYQVSTRFIYHYNFRLKSLSDIFHRQVIQKNILAASEHIAWDQYFFSQISLRKLIHKISSCDQTGNCDLLSKEIILYCIYFSLDIRKFLLYQFYHFTYIRRCQPSCCNSGIYLSVIAFKLLKSLFYLCFKQTHHTNTILQLKVSVISALLRKFISCKNIPFIRSMYKMNTMLLHHDLLPPLYLTDQIPCILFIKRFQWIQTFSIPGKAYRYD